MFENGSMPPPNLSPEELAKWWSGTLKKEGLGGRIETLSDDERICPNPDCGATNPCTGVDHCTTCNGSLKGAKRVKKSSRFDPNKY